MISVTVAAQGKSKRLFGGNLKAYGSGRLSICDLDRENIEHTHYEKSAGWKLLRIIVKLLEILSNVARFFLPFLFSQQRPTRLSKRISPNTQASPINDLDDELLYLIMSNLDAKSVVNCERVCQRWNLLINDNLPFLPKICTDQIRILFDEGEVVLYPIDEKKCPTRYPMPSLQTLALRLRHLTTQSLFVRGLIPVESGPVLKLLKSLSLQPQQIYFIWSKFSPDSVVMLEELMEQNAETVSDFGLEECSPSHLLTDRLLLPISEHLTSLRLWNNGKGSHYGITDETLSGILRAIKNHVPVETIDLATCVISNECVVDIIEAWTLHAVSDFSISLNNCWPVKRQVVLEKLAEKNIYFKHGQRMRCNNFTLTFFC